MNVTKYRTSLDFLQGHSQCTGLNGQTSTLSDIDVSIIELELLGRPRLEASDLNPRQSSV